MSHTPWVSPDTLGIFLLSENLVKFWKRLYSKQPFCQCGFSTNQQSFSCAKFWFCTKINFRIWLLPVKKKAIWGILGTSRRVSLFLEKVKIRIRSPAWLKCTKTGSENVHYPQRTVESVEKYYSALCDVHCSIYSDYHSDVTVTFHKWQKASDPDPQQEHFSDPGKKVFSTSVRCFFLI